ncbi:MAG: hypothetical protein A4E53_00788 [Pelotomaculum sp. PtaB.Bin104]|uniref:Peptidase M56 BlaR1 n=1 Tax=Pelotomaculum isophthalicicum JI TaxID=947010 RepID=A0A9X4H993_9FIRM|nr:hypothetical protein [Pelotomaculum isophthalicicum]MDF9409889.1 hypothetical protein [Pelotomaculum isophthalicicum JI]OPX90889.1 MAG: hypothetical protein A4E53_00788 [Pelotomaculum sp. PtaB.Bin104]
MKFKLLGLKTVIFGVALVAGIALGTLGILGIHDTTANAGSNYVFPKNQYGQTYGSSFYATSPETVPDLVAAVGMDDTKGYVKRTDLEQPFPKTPQEAIALNKQNLAHPTQEIPLYDVDGKTVIGKFIFGGGTVKEFRTKAESDKEGPN